MAHCLGFARPVNVAPLNEKGALMLDLFVQDDGANVGTISVVGEDGLKAWKKDLPAAQNQWVESSGFKAGTGEVLLLPNDAGSINAAVVGVGDGSEPFAAGAIAHKLPEGMWQFDPGLAPETLRRSCLAFALHGYRFGRYREDKGPKAKLRLPDDIAEDVNSLADGVYLARDLINTPPNDMGPDELEKAVLELAKNHQADAKVIHDSELLEQDLTLIYTVGQASARRPRLITFTWGRDDAPKVTLVGKGVCFDSGGLDLKPSSGMALMKKDMGGAANVLGLASMIMSAGIDVRLHVLVPAVENSVGSNAFRTSDVYTSKKGLTVEIGNTDAEGRLILADALAIADEEEPELLIDMATLTGAARSALGPDVAPFYTADDDLAQDIADHAITADDHVWRMPLVPAYDKWLDSPVANLSSTGSLPMAGSITAALFLKRFVTKTSAYVHFDIYGWTNRARPGKPLGGEAHGIRALFSLLDDRYGRR